MIRCSLLISAAVVLFSNQLIQAGSATWNLNPSGGNWSTATNWTPASVPDGPTDIATFDASNVTNLNVPDTTTVDSIIFNSGAPLFSISSGRQAALTFVGTGITNNSGGVQTFVCPVGLSALGSISFMKSATAGTQTAFLCRGSMTPGYEGGEIDFFQTSNAGNASLTAEGGAVSQAFGGDMLFRDSASAANAILIVEGGKAKGGFGAFLDFLDSSTAAASSVTTDGGGKDSAGAQTSFSDIATAGHATFINNPGTSGNLYGGAVIFFENATAGSGSFTNAGSDVLTAKGGFIQFDQTSNGDNATLTNNGGTTEGALGGSTEFVQDSTSGNATLIANGGSGGGNGGFIGFADDSIGDTASIEVFDNGNLDISPHHPPGITVGSIEGSGIIFLGSNNLTVGSNSRSTIFSGEARDGGMAAGTGGSLTKTGLGKLILSAANTYTGGTTVARGALLVSNATGSGTGTGPVQVNAGTLSGTGTIAGAVTIGRGTGRGAFLSPDSRHSLGTLTIQSTLVFQGGDATYDFALNSSRVGSDQVTASGVTIHAGTVISLVDNGTAVLPSGTVFTPINNTAAGAIIGTFDNLPDGSTTTVGSNTFQANYEGGDGNDLTLTVVP